MAITKATLTDIPELEALVNSVYRSKEAEKTWTSEAGLLEGIRIDRPTLEEYFQHEQVTILKNTEDGEIIGTVYLEIKDHTLYLGMLSVSIAAQGKQVGRTLLEEAEAYAKQFGCDTISMTVLSIRKELISWYERRGYVFTGEKQPFYDNERFGKAKQPLEFIVMEKNIIKI